MKLESDSITHNGPIPGELAFCVPAEEGHVTMGSNCSPHFRWSDFPPDAKSFAMICHDPDVPSKPDDVNQEGRTVPRDLPRVDFFHWALVDIPAHVTELPVGADSEGITPSGKEPVSTAYGKRGINSYTDWFKGDPDMGGIYGGYDGPCPPWNDEILHHYHFTLYALDVENLALSGGFTGTDALKAMEGHILGQATIIGTYSLNPDVA